MAGWTTLPVVAGDTPAAQHMDELRAAMSERNDLLDGSGGSDFWYGQDADYSRTLPTDVAVGDPLRHMAEYRYWMWVASATTPSLIGANMNDPLSVLPWAAGESDDFKTLTGENEPLTGEKNVFADAGLGGTIWRMAMTDPVSIAHPNDVRSVLNRLVRLKSTNLVFHQPLQWYNDGSTTPCGVLHRDTGSWNDIRAAAFALAATYPGSGTGYAGIPLLGRTSWDMEAGDPGEEECEINCNLKCKATINLAFGASATASAVWLLLGRYSVAEAHPNYSDPAEFDIGIYVGGVRQAGVTTGAAADIEGFRTGDNGQTVFGFDAWKIEVDPADLDLNGSTEIELRFESSVTADPGYAEHGSYCQAMLAGADEPNMALVIEFDHLEYVA
ncbi:MAG: hypothetical protein GXY74_15595 [Phycisphaerae bacterium]|nr:hypothetical protein [Phycisphaerae bacterium]